MGERLVAGDIGDAKVSVAGRPVKFVEAFLDDLRPSPFVVVVKPIESGGSDGVHKCDNLDQVKAAFDNVNGAINALGMVNEGILVQEFLDGSEYVIDSVSRDGVHKVVAVWVYEKRSANGADFVYFGVYLCPAAGAVMDQLLDYGAKVRVKVMLQMWDASSQRYPCVIFVSAFLLVRFWMRLGL